MCLGCGNSSIWYTNWLGSGPLCNKLEYVNIVDTDLTVRDIWCHGGWNLSRLAMTIPQMIRDSILHIPVPVNVDPNILDCWVWKGNKEGVYTVASGYSWLLRTARDWVSNRNWKWVWKLPAPAKVQHMVWLLLHHALPTNALRFKRGMSNSPNFQRCSGNIEDILHCLWDCPHIKELWMRLGLVQNPPFLVSNDPAIWVEKLSTSDVLTLFLAGIWWAWRWRNNMVLGNEVLSIDMIMYRVYSSHEEFTYFLAGEKLKLKQSRGIIHWSAPC